MDPQTRALIRERSISVWLRAELEVLLQRVARRSNRPLLKQGDPRAVLSQLIERRYPVYAEADLVVDSIEGPPELTLARVIDALQHYFKRQAA
jgi:shikimate kinase